MVKRQHPHLFFVYRYVKFLQGIVWYMRECGTLRITVLHSESPEERLQMLFTVDLAGLWHWVLLNLQAEHIWHKLHLHQYGFFRLRNAVTCPLSRRRSNGTSKQFPLSLASSFLQIGVWNIQPAGCHVSGNHHGSLVSKHQQCTWGGGQGPAGLERSTLFIKQKKLFEYLKRGEEQMSFGVSSAALHVWIGWLRDLGSLDD